jgi:hypothetical protein
MGDAQHRNVSEVEPLGRFDPAMTGNDLVGVVYQDCPHKSEAFDAVGDLLNLLFGVGACVRLAGFKPVDRDHFDVPVNTISRPCAFGS